MTDETSSSLEQAKELFSRDRYATEVTGAEIIEATPGHARCHLRLTERHRNAMGAVMGGVYFTLADFTFAIASNFEQTPTVSVSSTIEFLSAPHDDDLYSECVAVRDGRRICFFEVSICDGSGRKVASVMTNGLRLSGKAPAEPEPKTASSEGEKDA